MADTDNNLLGDGNNSITLNYLKYNNHTYEINDALARQRIAAHSTTISNILDTLNDLYSYDYIKYLGEFNLSGGGEAAAKTYGNFSTIHDQIMIYKITSNDTYALIYHYLTLTANKYIQVINLGGTRHYREVTVSGQAATATPWTKETSTTSAYYPVYIKTDTKQLVINTNPYVSRGIYTVNLNDIVNNSTDYTTLVSTVSVLVTSNTNLTSRVVTLENTDVNLTSRVVTLENENAALSSRVVTLENENATLISRIEKLEGFHQYTVTLQITGGTADTSLTQYVWPDERASWSVVTSSGYILPNSVTNGTIQKTGTYDDIERGVIVSDVINSNMTIVCVCSNPTLEKVNFTLIVDGVDYETYTENNLGENYLSWQLPNGTSSLDYQIRSNNANILHSYNCTGASMGNGTYTDVDLATWHFVGIANDEIVLRATSNKLTGTEAVILNISIS